MSTHNTCSCLESKEEVCQTTAVFIVASSSLPFSLVRKGHSHHDDEVLFLSDAAALGEPVLLGTFKVGTTTFSRRRRRYCHDFHTYTLFEDMRILFYAYFDAAATRLQWSQSIVSWPQSRSLVATHLLRGEFFEPRRVLLFNRGGQRRLYTGTCGREGTRGN